MPNPCFFILSPKIETTDLFFSITKYAKQVRESPNVPCEIWTHNAQKINQRFPKETLINSVLGDLAHGKSGVTEAKFVGFAIKSAFP